MSVLFLEEWAVPMSDRWRRVPELLGLVYYFLLHFNWIPFSKEAVLAASNSLLSQVQVLLILISPPVFCRRSLSLGTAVICVC